MVLQAHAPAPVWGYAEPGAVVTVAIGDQRHEAVAAEDGSWRVTLKPLTVGGPYNLRVETPAASIVYRDILAGEVWLCSGQSNMEWPLDKVDEAEAVLPTTSNSQIRLFDVARASLAEPTQELTGNWTASSPESAARFSAVAYYFGRLLQHRLDRPIGLIHSSWGGSRIEAWMPRSLLETLPQADELLATFDAIQAGDLDPDSERNLPRTGTQRAPAHLYNGMIEPLAPYRLAGVIWYQGEANQRNAEDYAVLFPAMIQNWRARWQQEIPFYYVELANFRERQVNPVENEQNWPVVRQSQKAALRLPATGVATAIDVGVADDIHPRDKKTVGERLAKAVLADMYNHASGDDHSPRYADHTLEAGQVVVTLSHAEAGLVFRPQEGEPHGFALQDAEGNWHWAATVEVQGKTIRLAHPDISEPRAARYAWADNPFLSVFSPGGLPLLPFQTDAPAAPPLP